MKRGTARPQSNPKEDLRPWGQGCFSVQCRGGGQKSSLWLSQVNEPPRGLWGSKSSPDEQEVGEVATSAFLGNALYSQGTPLGWVGSGSRGVPPPKAPHREHWPHGQMKAAQVSPVARTFPTLTPGKSGFLIYVSRDSVSWKL